MVLHIYLEYHTEMGQLIIIKQLCQKMFYLTFYIDCWINIISEVWMFIISPKLLILGCQISCTHIVSEINKDTIIKTHQDAVN